MHSPPPSPPPSDASDPPPPPHVSRRDLVKLSAVATAAAALGTAAPDRAAPARAAGGPSGRRKTFLAIEGHMDDAEIGAGGVLIQAARAGHRVVIVLIASNLSSWTHTVGREDKTRRQLVELAQSFGFEKRFLGGRYHQSSSADLELKKQLAEIYVELKPDVCFVSHHEDHWPDHREGGLAAKDAFLFSQGLAQDMRPLRAPLILGYSVTPIQTYRFEPDVFYDVTDVMAQYLDLIAKVEAVRTGRTLEQEIRAEYRTLGPQPRTFPLTAHGIVRLADAIRWGNASSCPFAIGFRTVWGERRGPQLF